MRAGMRRATLIALLLMGSIVGMVPPGHAQGRPPIRIGLLLPYTGTFALYGNDIIEPAVRLHLEEIGSTVAGRKIDVFVEDSEAKPEVALTKARRLVERDKVHLIIGPVHSGVAYAIRDYIVRQRVPLIIPIAAAQNLTQKDQHRYIFGVRFAGGQLDAPGAWYAYHELGLRRVMTIGSDYAAPREMLKPFVDTFTKLGGTVVKQLWHPFGTTDFAPYLTEIKAAQGQIDAVSPMMFGAESISFMRQYREFGLTTPIVANGDVFEQTFLDKMGDIAIGAKTYWHYSPMRKSPENERFVNLFRTKTKRLPGAFAAQGYTAAKVVVEALKAVNGNIEDLEKFVDALERVKFESPAGPFEFDKSHGWRFNVYLQEVKKTDGVLAQYPLGPVIRNVDQFWTIDAMKK